MISTDVPTVTALITCIQANTVPLRRLLFPSCLKLDYMLLFLVAEGQMLNFGLNMSPTSVTLPSHPITVDEGRNKHYIDQLSVRVNAEFDSGAVSLKCSSVSSGKNRLG